MICRPIRPRRLPPETIYAGANTDLRFRDGVLVDGTGKPVRTVPLLSLVQASADATKGG